MKLRCDCIGRQIVVKLLLSNAETSKDPSGICLSTDASCGPNDPSRNRAHRLRREGGSNYGNQTVDLYSGDCSGGWNQ